MNRCRISIDTDSKHPEDGTRPLSEAEMEGLLLGCLRVKTMIGDAAKYVEAFRIEASHFVPGENHFRVRVILRTSAYNGDKFEACCMLSSPGIENIQTWISDTLVSKLPLEIACAFEQRVSEVRRKSMEWEDIGTLVRQSMKKTPEPASRKLEE